MSISMFKAHPNKAGMTYFEHMLLSLRFSFMLFVASIQAFSFETSTSDVIKRIDTIMVKMGCKKEKQCTENFINMIMH